MSVFLILYSLPGLAFVIWWAFESGPKADRLFDLEVWFFAAFWPLTLLTVLDARHQRKMWADR